MPLSARGAVLPSLAEDAFQLECQARELLKEVEEELDF